MSSSSVNSDRSEKVETSGGGATASASRFAQFQSSFYRKTSFAPKIKTKKGVVKKQKEADKEASVVDSEKDIER